MEVWTLSLLTLAVVGSKWLFSRHDPFTPRKGPRYALNRRWGWAPGPVWMLWRKEKYLALTGTQTTDLPIWNSLFKTSWITYRTLYFALNRSCRRRFINVKTGRRTWIIHETPHIQLHSAFSCSASSSVPSALLPTPRQTTFLYTIEKSIIKDFTSKNRISLDPVELGWARLG